MSSGKSAKKTIKSKTSKVGKKKVAIRKRGDPLERITKPALIRVARRAGILRISHPVYDMVRSHVMTWLDPIVQKAIAFTEHDRRKTVQIGDLRQSLALMNIELAVGLNENAKRTTSLQSCNSRGKGKVSKKRDDSEKSERSHRFRPGIVAAREVKNQQKFSDNLAIPKSCFSDLVKHISHNYHEGIHFSKDVCGLLQLVAEVHLINLLRAALLIASHSHRQAIAGKDIELVLAIQAVTKI